MTVIEERCEELCNTVAMLCTSNRITQWHPKDRVELAGTIDRRTHTTGDLVLWDDLHPWERALLHSLWRVEQISADVADMGAEERRSLGELLMSVGTMLRVSASDERDEQVEARDAAVYDLTEWADTKQVGF